MDPLNELKSIVKSGRIPNSFLFKGPAGSGKLRAAVGFANNVFNLNKNSKLDINKTLNHPDLHIIFPIPSSEKKSENNCDIYINSWRELATEKDFKISLKDWSDNLETKKQPQINIDSVRVLAKKLSLSSFGFGYKVVLFWMADRLNEAASNKLLKIVEEPGEKTVFIFPEGSSLVFIPFNFVCCRVFENIFSLFTIVSSKNRLYVLRVDEFKNDSNN